MNPVDGVAGIFFGLKFDAICAELASLQSKPSPLHEIQGIIRGVSTLLPQEQRNSLIHIMKIFCKACISVRGDPTSH